MRQIIHLDLDAFYAAVEQRDNPDFRGKPVIVGGRAAERGVVSTASYEARKFGVRSGMPLKEATRICPKGIFIPVNMAKYVAAAEKVFAIYEQYTPCIEKLSLDEAFLDVTGSKNFGTAEEIGAEIKKRVKEETSLTVSVGVAPNKFLAKLASDLQKPDGFVVLKPDKIAEILEDLAVERVWGVGGKSAQELRKMGIDTIGKLAKIPPKLLEAKFGKRAQVICDLAKGIDPSPVDPESVRKSYGREVTFPVDIAELDTLKLTLRDLSESIGYSLRQSGVFGKTITLKLRYADFTTLTRNETIICGTNLGIEIFKVSTNLLSKLCPLKQRVRLIGVAVSNLSEDKAGGQMSLLDDINEKQTLLAKAVDKVAAKYGEASLIPASLLSLSKGNEKSN